MRTGITRAAVLIVAAIIVLAAVAGVAIFHLDLTGRDGNRLGPDYQYDLSAHQKTDPALMLYAPAGRIETGFKLAQCLTVDKTGRLYVTGDSAVRVFSPDGARFSEIPLDQPPHAIAISDDGTLYVGFKDHVEVLDASGKKLAAWESLGDRAIVTSIAPAGENVFLADAGNRVVHRFGRDGKRLSAIDGRGRASNRGQGDAQGFVIPSPYFDVLAGTDGLLRAVNPGRHRIEAYTPEGDLETVWGRPAMDIDGFSGCCNPVHIARLPDGRFVTSEKGLLRVKVYSPEGKFQGVVAGPEVFLKEHPDAYAVCEKVGPGCQTGGLDVATDADGRVLVLDPAGGFVRVFVEKTTATAIARKP